MAWEFLFIRNLLKLFHFRNLY